MRLDKYLWALRYFKTRNIASEACKKGQIRVNDQIAKPSREVYPMDKVNFIYLQYELNGESIPKKLDFHDDVLELTAKEIYTVDGKSLPIPEKTKIAIYYRNSSIKKSTKISEFNLISPDSENLKVELEVIIGELKAKDAETRSNEIAAYLYEFYGKPQKENLKDWLNKNMSL